MMNENYAQPDLLPGSEADIVRECYQYRSCSRRHSLGYSLKIVLKTAPKVTLMGSGAILMEVIKAADHLEAMDIDVTVFSVTSSSELARDGAMSQEPIAVRPEPVEGYSPFITQQLMQSQGPIIAATDYVRAVPESIRAYLPEGRRYTTLGIDGFGRSDTRAAIRAFFSADAASIVRAALAAIQAD